MISSKYISRITITLISTVLILCVALLTFSDRLPWLISSLGYGMEYQEVLFNTDKIINISIDIDENDWKEMLDKATEENYYECNVMINDTMFYQVGIRTKGNTSLSSVAKDPDNNRYSFKLEFDHYVDGQTCFGLDKLVLNNNYADVTNMKEAIIYDMFQYLQADASLYNYAKISVNNEYWGVYFALEAVEDSFMLKNYGAEKGHLYKPDGMNQNHSREEENKGNENPNNQGFYQNNGGPDKNGEGKVNGENKDKMMPGRGGSPGGGGRGSDGANLNYTDDDLDSYSAIWDGEVNNGGKEDHKRVVEALKNISEKNNVEKYIDVEQILKYMAVHNFSVNEDSLSGNMAHNYYLYESGGQISIIPWDYNLSFGGMNGGSATDVVNDAVDEKYDSTELFDFVFEDEEYLERYHEYYNKLVSEYLYGGRFDNVYKRIRLQIDELVKSDPNAMYNFDEYTKAAEALYETIMLRAESVKGQLDGEIPSTQSEQRENAEALVDASQINLSDMGQFMGGGKGGVEPNKQPTEREHPQEGNVENRLNASPTGESGNGREFVQGGGNEERKMPSDMQNGQNFNDDRQENPQKRFDGKDEKNGSESITEQYKDKKGIREHIKEYFASYISILLLAAAFIFVKMYRRIGY